MGVIIRGTFLLCLSILLTTAVHFASCENQRPYPGEHCRCSYSRGLGQLKCETARRCNECLENNPLSELFCRNNKVEPWEQCHCLTEDQAHFRCIGDEECKKCEVDLPGSQSYLECRPKEIENWETCHCVQKRADADIILFECNEQGGTCMQCAGEDVYMKCNSKE